MRNLMLGLLIGSALTGTLAGAATLYDSKGHPNAPTGSIQQFDYFRQRQLFLDQSAIRRAQEDHNPCTR